MRGVVGIGVKEDWGLAMPGFELQGAGCYGIVAVRFQLNQAFHLTLLDFLTSSLLFMSSLRYCFMRWRYCLSNRSTQELVDLRT